MKKGQQGGFIGYIILIIIGIGILSYLGFNIQGFVQSPVVQTNFGYVWNACVYVWGHYLQVPATWVWNNIFIIGWDAIQKLHQTGLTPITNSVPTVGH